MIAPIASDAHRPRDAAHAREVATVLHDGVDAPCGFRAGDKIARVRERLGHRLLAENMAACRKPRRNNFMPSRRHNNVEEEVRAALGDERVNVAGDDGIFQREFGGAPFGAFGVEVGQADNAQIGDPRGGLQPGPAHCATTDERGFQLHRRLSPGPAIVIAAAAVNVYDARGGRLRRRVQPLAGQIGDGHLHADGEKALCSREADSRRTAGNHRDVSTGERRRSHWAILRVGGTG